MLADYIFVFIFGIAFIVYIFFFLNNNTKLRQENRGFKLRFKDYVEVMSRDESRDPESIRIELERRHNAILSYEKVDDTLMHLVHEHRASYEETGEIHRSVYRTLPVREYRLI